MFLVCTSALQRLVSIISPKAKDYCRAEALLFIQTEVLKAFREEMTNSESDVMTQRGPFFSFLFRRTTGLVSGLLAPGGGMNAIKGYL